MAGFDDLMDSVDPAGEEFKRRAGPAEAKFKAPPLPAREKAVYPKADLPPLPEAPLPERLSPDSGGGEGEYTKQQDELKTANTPLVDVAVAAFNNQSFISNTIRRIDRGSSTNMAIEPGYRAPEADMAGMSADELHFMRSAVNPQDFAARKAEVLTRREENKTIGSRGEYASLAGGLAAGLPDQVFLNVVTPGAGLYAAGARTVAAAKTAQAVAATSRAARTATAMDLAGAAVGRAAAKEAQVASLAAAKHARGWKAIATDSAAGAAVGTGLTSLSNYSFSSGDDLATDFVMGAVIGGGLKVSGALVGKAVDSASGKYVAKLLAGKDEATLRAETRAEEKMEKGATPERAQEEILQEDAQELETKQQQVQEHKPERMLEEETPEPVETVQRDAEAEQALDDAEETAIQGELEELQAAAAVRVETPAAGETQAVKAAQETPAAKAEAKKKKAEKSAKTKVVKAAAKASKTKKAEAPKLTEEELDALDEVPGDTVNLLDEVLDEGPEDMDALRGSTGLAFTQGSDAPQRANNSMGWSNEDYVDMRNISRQAMLSEHVDEKGSFRQPIPVDVNGIKGFLTGMAPDFGTYTFVQTHANGVLLDRPVRMIKKAESIGADAIVRGTPAAEAVRWLQTSATNIVGMEAAPSRNPLGGDLHTLLGKKNDEELMALTMEAVGGTTTFTIADIEAARKTGQRILAEADVPAETVALASALMPYMPDGQVVVLRMGDSDVSAPVTRAGDTLVTLSKEGDTTGHLTTIHEVGHGIMTNALRSENIPVEAKDALAYWHRDLVKEFLVPGNFANAVNAISKRGPLAGFYMKQFLRMKENKVDVDVQGMSLLDVLMHFDSNGVRRDLEGASPKYMAALQSMTHDYIPSMTESVAEGFSKYIEHLVVRDSSMAAQLGIPESVRKVMVKAVADNARLMQGLITSGHLAPDTRFVDFMDAVLDRQQLRLVGPVNTLASRAATPQDEAQRQVAAHLAAQLSKPQRWEGPGPATPPHIVSRKHGRAVTEFQRTDVLSQRVGIDTLPTGDAKERGTYKAIRSIWYKALQWAEKNPYDPRRYSRGMEAVAPGARGAATVLSQSGNAVARWISNNLLESPTGAEGRKPTAAIRTALNYKGIMGNVVADYERLLEAWGKGKGGGAIESVMRGDLRDTFNRAVMLEIENRRQQRPSRADSLVVEAADAVEGAFQRSADMQRYNGTVGSKLLPASSRGYFPHKLSPGKVTALTNAQRTALAGVFERQLLQNNPDWTPGFHRQLAGSLVEHARVRANGGFEVDMNVYAKTNADVVEKALAALGLSQQEVQAHVKMYQRGAASHVRQRLELDMSAPFPLGGGVMGTLQDVYNTDVLALLRGQSQRVAGESALAMHGIMGEAGLAQLRQALEFGEGGGAGPDALRAFDQVAAEFLGTRFGTAGDSTAVNRATLGTTLLRLGGVVWNQIAESANLAAAVGVGRTMESVMGANRLRQEVQAIAKGQDPSGSILRDLERRAGVDYGLDGYRVSAFLDNHAREREVYGQETPTAFDRLLRGATHLQAKWTGWRLVQAVQQRGASEALLRHIIGRMEGEAERVGDADIGISKSLLSRLKAVPGVVQKDATGRVVGFDVTQIQPELFMELVGVLQRGTDQVIQQTHIGERSGWHHSDLARIFTQFRTYPITAIEKQWTRQRNIGGVSRAGAILLGSMSVAAPVYMARSALQSLGMSEDERKKYLDRALDPLNVAKASLNYVAVSGLAGDFIEALTDLAATKEDRDNKNILGRMAGPRDKTVVGDVFGPAADTLTDLMKAGQAGVATLRGQGGAEQYRDVTRAMPGGRAPWLVPFMNALKPEDD